MKLSEYMLRFKEFDRFVFYFGRFEITFNPKYDTPVFTSNPSHLGMYAMIEGFIKAGWKDVEIEPDLKILQCKTEFNRYRIEYQGVFMY